MSRRHTSDDYDEPHGSDRRGSRNRRSTGDSRYRDNPRYGPDHAETPIIRDLRERSFPLESRDYAESRESEEGAEIRIARGVRESRYRTYGRETGNPRDTMFLEDTEPTDRIRDRRALREIAATESTYPPREHERNTREVRYLQDSRQTKDEMDDARLLGRRREERDDTRIQYERGYQRLDQPSFRNDFAEESQSRSDNTRDSSRANVDLRGQTTYFVPGEGIIKEVIQADIRRYLGPDAACRPSTNRQGVQGYLIRASHPPTTEMIENLMADSKRWDHELRPRSYRPATVQERGYPEPIPGRMFSSDSRETEGQLIRQQPIAEYPQRYLSDRPDRIDSRAAPYAVGPNEERHYSRTDRVTVHGSAGHGGSTFSQNSTYESPSTASRATQWSSRSSYSTTPSSLQSMSDERRRFQGQEVAQHPPRHSSTSQYRDTYQDPAQAPQSYTDLRTGQRVTFPARRASTQRPAASPAMEPDDDPPDWDRTPNFRGFARGP